MKWLEVIPQAADALAKAMKTIRPYAGDVAVGLGGAFLVHHAPMWLSQDATSVTWSAVVGGAMCLMSFALDWYDVPTEDDSDE